MFEPLVSTDLLAARNPPVNGDARWFVIQGGADVLVVDGEIPESGTCPVDAAATHLLGVDGDRAVWAVAAADDAVAPDLGQWQNLRKLYGSIPEEDWAMAGRAVQVLAWDRDHQFCSRCGSPTEPHQNDRAKVCPACGYLAYPRLTPAIIVLVERDDGRALLAWGRQFPGRFYSALAGFVEPGESLEECVRREVAEEVGIVVDDITYFGSQPWPFPHSLMVGYRARYVSGELRPQESEIVEADWYHHEALPPAPRGGMSIAGWLIEDWIRRQTA